MRVVESPPVVTSIVSPSTTFATTAFAASASVADPSVVGSWDVHAATSPSVSPTVIAASVAER